MGKKSLCEMKHCNLRDRLNTIHGWICIKCLYGISWTQILYKNMVSFFNYAELNGHDVDIYVFVCVCFVISSAFLSPPLHYPSLPTFTAWLNKQHNIELTFDVVVLALIVIFLSRSSSRSLSTSLWFVVSVGIKYWRGPNFWKLISHVIANFFFTA